MALLPAASVSQMICGNETDTAFRREILQNEFIQLYQSDAAAIPAELAAGLWAPCAHISPKFLYDALGSKLFEAICELPEYYPTRVEAAIFEENLPAIAASVGRGMTLIDLGAGNCAKAAKLFDALRPTHYVPVDISVDFLKGAVACLQHTYPHVRMTALGMDFSNGMELPEHIGPARRLFFYPGSSIGNFTPDHAASFLARLRRACGRDGGLLIGIDLVKDAALLNAAYDDQIGVTAAFNLNVLRHLNRLLGTDFAVRDWRHRAFFNEAQSRVEMHLEARRDVTVHWPQGSRRFREGERIHTESSYKYTREGFLNLLARAGFGASHTWSDANNWFMVCHARAV